MIEIRFEGIDYWSRPVFKNIKSKSRYGSLNYLFPDGTSEKEVLEKVSEKDLCFFGNSVDCEPMGDLPIEPLKIIRRIS